MLGPRKAELDELREEVGKESSILAKKKKKRPAGSDRPPSSSTSRFTTCRASSCSPSSAARRMLLTGDARGDFILDSLAEAKLLKDGRDHVDILRCRTTAATATSRRSSSRPFMRRHYVFSANGRDGNPDPPTFDRSVQGPAEGAVRSLADEQRRRGGQTDQGEKAGRRHAARAGRPRRPGPRRAGVRHSVVKTAARRRPVGRLASLAARRCDAGQGDAERAASRAGCFEREPAAVGLHRAFRNREAEARHPRTPSRSSAR